MEKQGYVSLWIGHIRDEMKMQRYTELIYTDEDCLPAPFLADFHIAMYDYDEDFLEAIAHDREQSCLRNLIEGCSYDEDIIPQFEKLFETTLDEKTNAVILVYNLRYDGRVEEIVHRDCAFRFVGSVAYEF
ncbi:hypothetical protein BAMA_24610 [Bacillus manliponensis]|uniref:Immunity protein 22 n=1 Tax=Bacillus manliponensis TaxID=574376 RepID=A0A073JY18_9BACI|nr:immunity 22 family protein [Bacillus manliponensis]KEK19185.1 hypothetical protein BAMA_24610 [Bacillus manliponensis]